MRSICFGLVAAALLPLGAAYADPPPKTPDVADLLFGAPQWNTAPVGATLTYQYTKKVDAAYGPSFDDKVVETLEKGDDAKSRTVDVKLFTGERAKPAGPFQSAEQNPILLIALEANVEDLSQAWHANPRYMKDAVRTAWRDDAQIEKAQVEVAGKSMPGTRITIEPYKDSSEKDKMMGLQTMVYTIEIADGLPGQIAKIDIHAPATGTPTFSEVMRYQSEAKP